MSGILSTPISRRTALKASAGVVALAALGKAVYSDSSPKRAHAAAEATNLPDETVYSWCRHCASPRCGIQVDVKNGVAVRVQGNPDWPNKGALCARGISTLATFYNPYRVKTPLKRTNPKKGLDEDPGWVEISWEEAMTTIADKLKAVRAKDPRRFMLVNGFSRSGSIQEGLEFCEAFGSPNYIEVDGPTCSVHFGAALLMGNFGGPSHDPGLTNYLIMIGQGSTASNGYANNAKSFAESIARGMRLISVNPRSGVESSKGEWLPIRPGTDLAFVLALQQIIVHEMNRFDVDSIKHRTNGPYLIGPDRHYVRDKATGKPVIWDPKDNAAKTFDDPSIQDFALEGNFTVDGVACEPGFQIYKRGIKEYTAEWAEEKTTIPAATIRRIAKEFVDAARIGSTITIDGKVLPFRPACVESGRGAITQHYGGNYHIASIMCNMLVGSLDVPGGASARSGPQHKGSSPTQSLRPDKDGIVEPKSEAVDREFEWPPNRLDGKSFFPFSHDNPHLAFEAILDPEKYSVDYTPDAMMVWAGNPVVRMHRPDKVVEAFLKVPFVFTLSYSIDEPALLADIVLPEAIGGLERWSSGGRITGMTAVAHPVINPVYDSRSADEVFFDLADRIGILLGPDGVNAKLNSNKYAPVRFVKPFLLDVNKRYTVKELAELVYRSGVGEKGDLDATRNNPKPIMKVNPAWSGYPYAHFPQARYALYVEPLMRKGEALTANLKRVNAKIPGFTIESMLIYYQPVPHWIDQPKQVPAEYDLYAFNWKTAQYSFGQGGSVENPWLREAAQFDPFLHKVCLHPETAAARGIAEGDEVWIEAFDSGGKIKGPVKLTETVHPGTVGVAGLFGHYSKQMNPIALGGLHFNVVMPLGVDNIDPLGGGFGGTHMVKVYKA